MVELERASLFGGTEDAGGRRRAASTGRVDRSMRTMIDIDSALFLDHAGRLARTSDTRPEAADGWKRRRWHVCRPLLLVAFEPYRDESMTHSVGR